MAFDYLSVVKSPLYVGMEIKKVFISYASKDKWVKEWLVPKLEEYGIDVQADYKTFLFGKTTLENIELAIETSHHTFFVITENWLASEWKALESLILQTESPVNRDLKYFVLKREECNLPQRLKIFHNVDLTDEALVEIQIKRLVDQICNTPNGKPESKPQNISLSRLPDTSGLLFGREAELKLLDEAWENPYIHVISFVAQGGEGKTALTRRWVNNMAKEGFRGAERVYAWSFYSQGTSEDRQVSGDLFLAETLTWFGDAAMANSPASARQKAQRLATLVRQQKTLLILDGVEPLQYPLGEPHNGRMRDEGVKVLLKELASSNSGLCVVSTRQEIRELKDGLVLQQPLSPLSPGAGADLLAELLRVKNRRQELEAASKEYYGHALALTLLGNLLREYHHGDIRQRHMIPPLEEEDVWGSHAKRVLTSYAMLLEGKPELGILRIMSLFDRPADVIVVNELRKYPAILAITEALVALSEIEWKRACKHLRDLGLLQEGDQLDCHPLIREHFAVELLVAHEEAWKEAHRRLYEYYEALPEKEFPDTLEEMEPLYRAMGHGCKAGLYQEAFLEILVNRINRKSLHYSLYNLASYSSILAAIVFFFDTPWKVLNSKLSPNSEGTLMNFATWCLRAVGRLREAKDPNEIGLEFRKKNHDWSSAGIMASNLSELLLQLGEIKNAIDQGSEAVSISRASQNPRILLLAMAVLSEALLQAGNIDEVEVLFQEAEAMREANHLESRELEFVLSLHFREYLLLKEEWTLLLNRIECTKPTVNEYDLLFEGAINHLHTGKALHLQANKGDTGSLLKASTELTQCIASFRSVNRMDYIPQGLLARAALLRDMKDYEAAQADLDEVYEIADPEMRLHLTDYHLESARLCLSIGNKHPEAQDQYEKAKKLIEETGYHRRYKELEELRTMLEIAH